MTNQSPCQYILAIVQTLRDQSDAAQRFEEFLTPLESQLQLWAQAMQRMPLPPGDEQAAAQMMEETLGALQLYANAVVQIRHYAATRQESYAENAVQMALHGDHLIQHLAAFSEQSIERISQDMQAAKQTPNVTYTEATDAVSLQDNEAQSTHLTFSDAADEVSLHGQEPAEEGQDAGDQVELSSSGRDGDLTGA